jgi:hypothetical protein
MSDRTDQALPPDPPAQPAASPPPRPRRRRRRFLYPLLALAGALAIAVALLPALLSLSIGKDRLLAIAGRSLDAPVEAEALSLSWLGEQSLSGLRVGSPAGFPAAEDVLRVERIAVKRSLLGLLFSGGVAVEIERPVVTVRRNAEGVFNFEALLGRQAHEVAAGVPAEAPEGRPEDRGRTPGRKERAPLPSSRFSVAVEDGLVAYHDDALGTAAEVRAIEAEGAFDPGGGTLRVEARVRHPGAESAPGRLSVRATVAGWQEGDPGVADLDVEAAGIDLEPWKGLLERLGGLAPAEGPFGLKATARVAGEGGTGRVEVSGGLSCRGWTVSGAAADLRVAGRGIVLENGSASVNGGRAAIESLSVSLDADPPRFAGALRIEGAAANYELAPLLAYAVPFLSLADRKADFQGTIDGRLSLEGTGLDRAAIGRSLRGQGALRVRDGKISASRFFQDAAKIAGVDLEEVLFSEMGSDFEIADEKVRSSKVFLTGKPGSKLRNLGLKGETTLDGRIDFGVDLAALEETVGSKRIRRILQTARKAIGDSVFPLKLKGTLRSPELAFDPARGFSGLDGVLEEERGEGGVDLKDILDAVRSRRRKDGER